MSWWTDLPEINISPLNVCKCQLHANPVADIHALEPMHQLPFNRQSEKPDPGAFRGSARDNGIKLLSDSRFKQKRGSGFADLPFDFVGGILFFRAMRRQNIQFILAIGHRLAFHGGLQQALRDQIGIAAIRGGGMGIVLDRETKVPWGSVAWKLCNVFTRS